MKDKEMIEEMANDIQKAVNGCAKYWAELIAKHLIKQGYTKIDYKNIDNIDLMIFKGKRFVAVPEGSVVLDRQEHQKYCAYKIIEPQIKGCLDRERKLEKQIAELEEQRDKQAYIAEELIQEKHRWTEQARKETAEKILKDIMFCIDINDCNKNEMLIFNLCKMLAKQYGVEVEE